jgi:hypothetical protein
MGVMLAPDVSSEQVEVADGGGQMDPNEKPDYRHLPEPIRLEDTRAELDTRDVPDPDGGRDPERDFFLRYAAPI